MCERRGNFFYIKLKLKRFRHVPCISPVLSGNYGEKERMLDDGHQNSAGFLSLEMRATVMINGAKQYASKAIILKVFFFLFFEKLFSESLILVILWS